MVKVTITVNDKEVKSETVTKEQFPDTWYKFQDIAGGMWNPTDTIRVSNKEI